MKTRPNILWIVTTQWRASATGYAGDPNARTPSLDLLAAKSVNYTQAVTPHPFGPFARAALLTGVLSPDNGVRDYFDSLPEGARTIADEMKDRGYSTAFFGKWHLAKRDPTAALVGEVHAKMNVPVAGRGGFEFWEGFESGFLLNDPWLQGTRLSEPLKFGGYQSDVLCERAGMWLNETEQRKRPWFCVVSLESPHPPYEARAAGVAPSPPESLTLPDNVPRGGKDEAKARRELAGYYAHITATDRAMGGLVEGLNLNDVAADTRIVFTSVHGDMHGAHGLFRKGWPYEESIRVPLLVRGSPENGREYRGISSSELVSLVDLPRSTLAWADGAPGGIFKPPLPAQRISMPSIVALPQQCDRKWSGLRTDKRKLILDHAGEPWLFFDLERDPLEQENLVGQPAWTKEIAHWRARMVEGK